MESSAVENTTKTVAVKTYDILDSIGRMQTAWGLLVAVTLILTFTVCLITFRKKVNRDSKLQIQAFIKAKKYIPSLYIELNRNMECLRYLIYSNRWKHRIIRQYNQLFSGYEGSKLKAALCSAYKYHLPYYASISTLRREIESLNNLFESIRSERPAYLEKLGQYFFVIRNLTYDYIQSTKQLMLFCNMIQEKTVLLVGSAGNGKTSLMCRAAEVIIANNMPLMLINARDIDINCVEYILNKLPLFVRLKNVSWLYLRILSISLFLRRKHFYILIDAINENDREVFTQSIGRLSEHFSKYRRIRMVYSCRSEYFDSRFCAYFTGCNNKPFVFDIMAGRYNARASRKMLMMYGESYNVGGAISIHVQEKLLKSLFLMRIFFEVNSNQGSSALEFRNAEIYKQYFEKVAAEVDSFNFLDKVNEIAEIMITNADYSGVKISDLNLSGDDIRKFTRVLDDNLIISRTVCTGSGITERSEEIVYFVFDELRDFCLARYLLIFAEDGNDATFHLFFEKASEMFVNRQSPIEGVLKYAYYHFKTNGLQNLCENILVQYGESDVQDIAERQHWNSNQRKTFYNFGLSLVFMDGGEISDFEFKYIQKCVANDSSNYWNIFWFLLANEYSGIHPRLELALRILLHNTAFEVIENIISFFFADRHDYRYGNSEENRRIDVLCDWLEHIEKHNGCLSIELQQILIILSALEPHEHILYEYRELVLDDSIRSLLIEQISCHQLIDCIQEFKEQITLKPLNEQSIHQFLLSFLHGGDTDDC